MLGEPMSLGFVGDEDLGLRDSCGDPTGGDDEGVRV